MPDENSKVESGHPMPAGSFVSREKRTSLPYGIRNIWDAGTPRLDEVDFCRGKSTVVFKEPFKWTGERVAKL